jgi:hypothetical protein
MHKHKEHKHQTQKTKTMLKTNEIAKALKQTKTMNRQK